MATTINLYPADEMNTLQALQEDEPQRGAESTQQMEVSSKDRSHTAQIMDTDK